MSLSIECSSCVQRRSTSCSDCLVTFISNREPDDAVIIDVAEFAAMRRLQTAGMLPELRHRDVFTAVAVR